MMKRDWLFDGVCFLVVGLIVFLFVWAMHVAASHPNPAREPRHVDVGSLPDGRKVSYYRVWTPHETKYIYMVDGVPVEVK